MKVEKLLVLLLGLIPLLCLTEELCEGPVCFVVDAFTPHSRRIFRIDCTNAMEYYGEKRVISYQCFSDVNIGQLSNGIGPPYEPTSELTSSPPTVINCSTDNLPTVHDGSFDCPLNVEVPIGYRCTLKCDEGFYSVSSNQTLCEADSASADQEVGWSIGNFICFAITCSTTDLPAVSNGSFDCPLNSNVLTGDGCALECEDGFYRASSERITCDAVPDNEGGKWSNGSFMCVAITCSTIDLPAVSNGTFDCPVNSNVSKGDSCALECEDGFYAASSERITCDAVSANQGGNWSSGSFMCLAITCSTTNLPTASNGSFDCPPNSNLSKGDQCNLTCEDGFYAASSYRTVCEAGSTNEGGEWSNGRFLCLNESHQAITCSTDNLVNVSKGSFDCPPNTNISVGGDCALTCNDGFYPAFSDRALCEAGSANREGEWSNGNFVCLEITCSTVNLPNVSQGSFDCPSHLEVSNGHICALACEDGFYSASSNQIVCEAGSANQGGQWSEETFECRAITCSTANLPTVSHGSFNCPLRPEVPEGHVCALACEGGFYSPSSNQIVCEAGSANQGGQWSEETFECRAITCSTNMLTAVYGGYFDCAPNLVLQMGAKCTLYCYSGFYSYLPNKAVCEAGSADQGGVWSQDVECREILCNKWNEWKGKKYNFRTTEQSWFNSRDWCRNNNAHLVTIENREENDFIQEMAQICAVDSGIWIGLNDRSREGVWKWSDGTVSSYRNWKAGEPEPVLYGTIYDCVFIGKNSGTWYDSYCYNKYYTVCEKNN